MKPRTILKGAVALGIAAYLGRLAVLVAADWQRYNRMRAMSDEGPLGPALPRLLGQAMSEEGAALKELSEFAVNAPYEFARYLRIQAM